MSDSPLDQLMALAWSAAWNRHERRSDDAGIGVCDGHQGLYQVCPHRDCALIREIPAVAARDQALAALVARWEGEAVSMHEGASRRQSVEAAETLENCAAELKALLVSPSTPNKEQA